MVAQPPYAAKPGPWHRRSCAGESVAAGKARYASEARDLSKSGFGAQPTGFGALHCGSWLQALPPGCFCVQVLLSPSLSLSCFSGQVGASFWVGQGWSTGWEHRGKEQRAQRWRQVAAPDGREGTLWWGARAGERKSWREAGDEEMGWNKLNEKLQVL